ncbi:MAG: phage head morphogenesis protein [Blastopirellula sp.]|nr:MAG: phage head morphogenesis protein [Blastopirellula sp.]
MAQGKPIVPRNKENPVGQVARIRRSSAAIRRQLSAARKLLKAKISSWPFQIIETNAKRYEYQISLGELSSVADEILIAMIGESSHELVVSEAMAAYENGTAQSAVNIGNISDDYTREITDILSGAPYQRRVSLISARVFEEMRGFDAQAAKELSRVLRNAVEVGDNPLSIVGKLSNQFGISQGRGEKIARTEITGALRRARMDEAEDARQRQGIRLAMKHFSANSSTTRQSHAARHGLLFSVQAVREWYAQDANGINCKCSQVEVLVDESGKEIGAGKKKARQIN